ncbi:hypothetical protein KC19_10G116100 [Ceratodon purpureus]|uniref:Uncharacterized protein n=1 Tax=Ceratodon purpureus TaxID=3225 RepID=A0A8T0GJ84_CERPU|nr:hypothetical protein KC19_10G116100 [Ceratodon purpureus]
MMLLAIRTCSRAPHHDPILLTRVYNSFHAISRIEFQLTTFLRCIFCCKCVFF